MKFNKVLVILFGTSLILWLGVMVARNIIAYDIFQPFDAALQFKADYEFSIIFHNVYLYTALAIYSTIGYIVFAITGSILSLSNRKYYKERSWLFLASIFFFLALPFQVFAIYSDTMLSFAIFFDGVRDFNHSVIQNNFLELFKNGKLQIWASLSMLCNITAVIILLYKPFNGFEIEEEEIEPGIEDEN